MGYTSTGGSSPPYFVCLTNSATQGIWSITNWGCTRMPRTIWIYSYNTCIKLILILKMLNIKYSLSIGTKQLNYFYYILLTDYVNFQILCRIGDVLSSRFCSYERKYSYNSADNRRLDILYLQLRLCLLELPNISFLHMRRLCLYAGTLFSGQLFMQLYCVVVIHRMTNLE